MANLFFPDNIFSRIIHSQLKPETMQITKFRSSASLSLELRNDESSIALIPVTDILTNPEFFISKTFGISFEGTLANSFVYFKPGERKVNEVNLAGDVSTLEVILTKILFKELFDCEVEVGLTTIDKLQGTTHIITGDQNFYSDVYEKGISFAEEIVEIISAPFVNFVLASKSEQLVKDFSALLSEVRAEANLNEINPKFHEKSKEFITSNLPKVFFSFDEQETEGINQITRLPYYHRLIEDIVDVKFV
ncbi:MAG TPA: hypothetical protein VH917_07320 [Ignavibacteriaceae bacterium]